MNVVFVAQSPAMKVQRGIFFCFVETEIQGVQKLKVHRKKEIFNGLKTR